MTEDNNIKIMKLSSGEEIISRLDEENQDHPRDWKIESPLKLMTVPKISDGGLEEQISLTRWIHFAEESAVSIPKSQVLGMATATVGLSKFYEYCLKKIDGEFDLYDDPSDSDLMMIEEEEWEEEMEDMMDSYDTPSKIYH
jgi:hypothetical protein